MNDAFGFLMLVLMLVISIVGAVNKNKRKMEGDVSKAAGRTPHAGAGSVGSAGSGREKPAGGTFAKVLEALSRQLDSDEYPLPPVVARPLSGRSYRPVARTASDAAPRPAMTSEPAATSYDYYSLENEYDGVDGRGNRDADDRVETEIAAYERLAARRAGRSTIPSAVAPATTATAADSSTTTPTDDSPRISLTELLGGEFDLRRAVIESEILNPKYAAKF